VITWIQLYAQHANFWLYASSMWCTLAFDMTKRPCASRDSGNGRVIWAGDRFTARRDSQDHVSAKRLGLQSAS